MVLEWQLDIEYAVAFALQHISSTHNAVHSSSLFNFSCLLHLTLCLTSPPVCTCIYTVGLAATFVNH